MHCSPAVSTGSSAVLQTNRRPLCADPRRHDDADVDELKFMVKNLDTGETFSIHQAEEKVEKGIDPLSLHIEKTQVCHHHLGLDEQIANICMLYLPY